MLKRKEWSELGKNHMLSILQTQTFGSTSLRPGGIDRHVLDDENYVTCGCNWRSLKWCTGYNFGAKDYFIPFMLP